MTTQPNNNSQSPKNAFFRVLRQIAYTKLFKKYTSGNFSYNKILANNLIFNDTCRVVARFKDYLIFDDNSEFLRRFYTEEESHPRLDRILTFYETYSKIFPNYMILKESKYLYRNIRKKQKMIDAVNEIKREEEENRKKMKQNNGKINKEINELFTKKVKEEIKTFQENTTFEKHRNQFDSDNEDQNDSSISISVMNRKMFFENMDNKLFKGELNTGEGDGDKTNSIYESFVANETNHSISGILNVLNDNKIYINDLPKLLEINNYSKNSKKLKNKQKQQPAKNIWKKNSPEKQNTKSNQLISPTNSKIDKNTKKNKKNEVSSRQSQLSKNISNSSNFNNNNGNYLSSKTFKKLSTPSTANGTVFSEKNFNDINQYQNIIIPKGSTVININNNYFEQIASSSLPMGYYTNQNFKINNNNTNSNNNNNYNSSTFKKSNTNQHYKNAKSSILNRSEKKPQQQNLLKMNDMNRNTEEQLTKNNTKKHHIKQISQDYIYQKNQNLEPTKFNKNEKCITNNEKEEKLIKEKMIKFGSLSPQPTITNAEGFKSEMKRIQEINRINRERHTGNFFTEHNDPNLITGDTKGNEDDEDDNKEREKLLLHIRDLIENKKKESINKSGKESDSNTLLSTKMHKLGTKNNENENILNSNNISKCRTISNFNMENPNQNSLYGIKKIEKIEKIERIDKDKDNLGENYINSNNKDMYMTNENLHSRKKLESIDDDKNENKNKNEEVKKTKLKNKIGYGFYKLPVKEKKNRTKGILKNNNTNNNYHTSTKLYKGKNKNLFTKTNNNFRGNKNLFNVSNQENSMKTTEYSNKIIKKNKLLNKRNNNTIKTNKSEIEMPSEKGVATLSHSILYKSPNSQLSKLLMSHKKEDVYITENNTSTKIYQKGKIKNMKYNKDDLNLDILMQNTNSNINPNNSCTANLNNYCSENLSNKIVITEHNNSNSNINANTNTNTNLNINNTNTNSNTAKTLTKTHNMNNSSMKNKYKSLLLKKNKQKSCELENQSVVQQKINQELIERMNLIKQNNKNNFYQNYKENKVKLQGIKNYIEKSLGSFDNLTNTNINMNSIGNVQHYARNSVNGDSGLFQTPSTANKKLGLYKKVISQKAKMMKSDKKLGEKSGKNFATPGAIKVNRSKFMEKVKDKFYDHNKMSTMSNFTSCLSHNNI